MLLPRLVGLAAVLSCVACADTQTPAPRADTQAQAAKVPQPRQEKIFPVGSSWTAVSLNGRPFTGERPSFTLNKQYRATGFGGCNPFSATAYPLREQGSVVGPFVLTKKSCDRARQQIEQTFLVALRTAAKWDIQGSTLTIEGQNGTLRFERAI